ncbi:MAG: SusC/RagA family TonB-linked outer membrane protein [Draconibacterium sp.]
MKRSIQKMLLTALSAVICFTAFSQVNVSGTVSGEDGELLPGVSILIKGTATGVITDIDGKYSLNSVPADATLVFSFVGMRTQEVAVDGRVTVNVTLQMSAIGVDEVVVTALGMKKDRKALGYNISSVGSEELEASGTSNALKSLEGKITGVQMNSVTSSPTSSVMFNIRGATSLAGIANGNRNVNNETQPLIVVNGVVVSTNKVNTTQSIDVGNYMSSINPDDIESISILKGASAAALYGSRAGNGVILITTKSGAGAKKGIGVSVNSSLSFDQAYSTPPVNRSFFQGGEEGEPLTEDKKGLGWAIDDTQNNNVAIPRWNIVTQQWENSILEVRGDQDPLKAFLQTGIMTDNNVAVTGNYDKGNYRANFGNMTYKDVIPSNKTIRNNISFDALYKITDKVTISSQASYSRTFVPNQSHTQDKRQDNPLAHAMSMPVNMPKMSVWKEADRWYSGWEGVVQNTPYLKNPGEDRLSRINSSGYDKAIGKNGPYFAAEEIIRTYSKNVIFGKMQLDYQIVKPLTLTLRSGLNHENFAFEFKSPWGAERKEGGQYYMELSNNLSINSDVLLAYSNYFLDDKFSIDALGGFSYNFGESNSSGFGGDNLTTPNSFTYNSLPLTVRQNASFSRGYASRSYGAYATASIGWQSMVYLELSGRNDWVGVLDHEKDHHFYPGVSLSWIASETFDFGSTINLLKLRGGYAETGYGIGNPPNLDSYGIGGSWNGIAMGTVGGTLIDANIEPELNKTKEIGVDFGLFENRIFGEFTAYSKDHINQIQNLPVVTSSGFSSVLTNMGAVESKGIEASITVVPVHTKDWTWSLTGNFTTFKSVIKELDDRFSEKFYGYEASTMMSLFKGSKVGDLYAENPIPRIQSGKYKGMMLFGQDGIIEEAIGTTDHVRKYGYLGNVNPDAIMSFNTDLKYKNWNLNIVSSLRFGGVFVSETQKIMIDDGMLNMKEVYGGKYNEYWTGGRWAGGLPSMPNKEDMFTGDGFEYWHEAMQSIMSMYNGDPRYFGYYNAVYIDPNYDLSGLEGEDKLNLPDEAYIRNGDDPLKTIYLNPYAMEGSELWSGAQFRTHSATSFKIKEINLTYNFNRALLSKIHIQDLYITTFAKNVMFWAKNSMNEDPETAFHDGVKGVGVAYFGRPPLRTMGLKVGFNF